MAVAGMAPVAAFALAFSLLSLIVRGSSSALVGCDEDLVARVTGDGYTKHDSEDMELHHTLSARALQEGHKLQFVAYGDSIMEDLSEADDALAIYAESFEMSPFGIGGDKAGELLWRVKDGEYNAYTMAPQFVSILVGTNDLRKVAKKNYDNGLPDMEYLDEKVSEVLESIISIVSYIHERSCGTHFILQAALPTAYKIENFWPNMYTPAYEEANRRLKEFAERYPEHVSFVDCGHIFLEGGHFRQDLMKDFLHPSKAGHAEMASCVLRHTHGVMANKAMMGQYVARRVGPLPGSGHRRRG